LTIDTRIFLRSLYKIKEINIRKYIKGGNS